DPTLQQLSHDRQVVLACRERQHVMSLHWNGPDTVEQRGDRWRIARENRPHPRRVALVVSLRRVLSSCEMLPHAGKIIEPNRLRQRRNRWRGRRATLAPCNRLIPAYEKDVRAQPAGN